MNRCSKHLPCLSSSVITVSSLICWSRCMVISTDLRGAEFRSRPASRLSPYSFLKNKCANGESLRPP